MIKRIIDYWLHKHDWVIKDCIVAKPYSGKVKCSSNESLRRLIQGSTTIIYECNICGKLHSLEVVGVVEMSKKN